MQLTRSVASTNLANLFRQDHPMTRKLHPNKRALFHHHHLHRYPVHKLDISPIYYGPESNNKVKKFRT